MPKYQKRPVSVDAVRVSDLLDAAKHCWAALPEWVSAAYEKGDLIFLADRIDVNSDCGWIPALRLDMLMRGVRGELYPCRRDVFEETYEPVPERAS